MDPLAPDVSKETARAILKKAYGLVPGPGNNTSTTTVHGQITRLTGYEDVNFLIENFARIDQDLENFCIETPKYVMKITNPLEASVDGLIGARVP